MPAAAKKRGQVVGISMVRTLALGVKRARLDEGLRFFLRP
jgi:hypothetical protein